MGRSRNSLIISDVQEPFGLCSAIDFCREVQKEYGVKDEDCYNAGDETDNFHGGMWPKDADYGHTPHQELLEARKAMKEWYRAFPKMKLAISNHGLRWVKKALASGIPAELLQDYKKIFAAPDSWVWKEEWRHGGKHPWRLIHGMGYSGKDGARNAALDAGISTAIGHLHSFAGVHFMQPLGRSSPIWGMNTGCLIDVKAYAFKYGKYNRAQPTLGVGVVIDSGRSAIWVPYRR